MPHATNSATGFQAFILCGPGASIDTFTSNPKDFPKALIPIANRPMVWYALDWCYRMGVTDITLITPPDASPALSTALAQNPYLTSLPAPKPTVLAPEPLTLTTGTAELFRLKEVQDAIESDFVVLPCDIICELNGSAFLETWYTMQESLGGGSNAHGEMLGRRGALAVHYQTKNPEEGGVGVKKEETDFIATAPIQALRIPPPPEGSLRSGMRNLVLSMSTATLKDVIEEKQNLFIRHALLRKHGNVRMLTTHRDAHIYLFPYWVKEFMRKNETFESVSEDVLGWWAKAGWQDGLAGKVGLPEILTQVLKPSKSPGRNRKDKVDLASMISTRSSQPDELQPKLDPTPAFASRVRDPPTFESPATPGTLATPISAIPPILTYTHSAAPTAANSCIIRRVDTTPLLLSLSLHLATLPALDEPLPASPSSTTTVHSPLAHPTKIHPTSLPLPPKSTVTRQDTLLDANVTLSERCSLRSCVIGPNCSIGAGARLTRCLLMDGVVVDENVTLNGCVLGRRSRVGKGSDLKDCEVQEGFVVEEGSVGKGETFKSFAEGLSDEEGDLDMGDASDNDDGEEAGL